MTDATMAEIARTLATLPRFAEPPRQPDLRAVVTTDDALAWIAGTAEVCEYVAFAYDLLSYAYGARALWAIHRRAVRREFTSTTQAVDHLTVTSRQLQLRAAICRRFDDYEVARGLTLAATHLAGLAAHIASGRR